MTLIEEIIEEVEEEPSSPLTTEGIPSEPGEITCETCHPSLLDGLHERKDLLIKERNLDIWTTHPSFTLIPKKDHKLASKLKQRGNDEFKKKNYEEAYELYSDAIDIIPREPEHSYVIN